MPTLEQIAHWRLKAGEAHEELSDWTLALVYLNVKELNEIRAQWTTFRAEVAAATSLADLQSRIAANTADLPPRTKNQTIAAIKNVMGDFTQEP